MGRVFRIIAAGASLLIAGGAIAAAVIGVAGADRPSLDAVNHLAPIWLIASLVALIMVLPLGKSRLRKPAMAFALLAIGLHGARVAPEFARRLSPHAAPMEGDERLKLIQFNAYLYNSQPQRAVDWLIAQQADVVVIEEAGGLTRPEQLRLLATYPHCSGCEGRWANMILSKRPILAQGRFQEEGLSTVNGGWSRLSGPGGEFTVVSAHLAWAWLPVARAQHAGLVAFAARQPKARLIIAGDFNMTPWSQALRRMDGRLGLNRVTHGQSSWPAGGYYKMPALPVLPLPYMAIDQVYAGQGWRLVRVRRGPRIGSDHYPIIVDLAATRPPRPRP